VLYIIGSKYVNGNNGNNINTNNRQVGKRPDGLCLIQSINQSCLFVNTDTIQ